MDCYEVSLKKVDMLLTMRTYGTDGLAMGLRED